MATCAQTTFLPSKHNIFDYNNLQLCLKNEVMQSCVTTCSMHNQSPSSRYWEYMTIHVQVIWHVPLTPLVEE
jgi:hypothetical protein